MRDSRALALRAPGKRDMNLRLSGDACLARCAASERPRTSTQSRTARPCRLPKLTPGRASTLLERGGRTRKRGEESFALLWRRLPGEKCGEREAPNEPKVTNGKTAPAAKTPAGASKLTAGAQWKDRQEKGGEREGTVCACGRASHCDYSGGRNSPSIPRLRELPADRRRRRCTATRTCTGDRRERGTEEGQRKGAPLCPRLTQPPGAAPDLATKSRCRICGTHAGHDRARKTEAGEREKRGRKERGYRRWRSPPK